MQELITRVRARTHPHARLLKIVGRLIRKHPDPDYRFKILWRVGKELVPNYRFKWPQMDWWFNPLFNDYLDHFSESDGMNTDRRWILSQLLRLVDAVPGDTAECGVYDGTSSYLICVANRQSRLHSRWHFMFDSFEGLSEPSDFDGSHWTKGNLASRLELAKNNLAEFTDASFHKGWIPERFSEVRDRSFCFVHIDVDLYEPTRDSISFFYPRLATGGILICDDYAFTTCPGATKAVDEFLSNTPEQMISLPCGGGFLIKGCQTAISPFLAR